MMQNGKQYEYTDFIANQFVILCNFIYGNNITKLIRNDARAEWMISENIVLCEEFLPSNDFKHHVVRD